jgi:hypothetical protein
VNTKAVFLLSLSLMAAACSDDFDPASRVSDLRVLAVSADQPFALPGSEVKLEALAFDPAARSLSWGWGVCIEGSSSLALDCLRALRFDSLTIGQDQPRHILRVPETDAPFVGVVVVACPGTIVAGNTEGVPLACVGADDRPLPLSEFELGLKRIYLRDSQLNHNPTFDTLIWDGVPWPEGEVRRDTCARTKDASCDAFTEHALEARAAADAVEKSIDREQLPITEQVVVQLYATGGEFEDDVRVVEKPTNTWKARREDAGQRITFWFVVRDDRGGVSWISRQLDVP